MEVQLEVYRDYQPTPFDPTGAFLENREDWVVVSARRTRDSGPLAESNFVVALQMLGGEGKDVEVHRFRHWGPGWVEIILVRPDTEAHEIAKEIAIRLVEYPILDEEDCSAREYDAALDAWRGLDLEERIRICVDHGVSKFAARHEDKIPRGLNHWEDFYCPE